MSLLVAKNISHSYRIKGFQFGRSSTLEAIKNISFSLEKGKTLAIVGESGSGKSTLARQIIGIEKPSNGEIYFNGKKLEYKKDQKNRFKNIRMIFQNSHESLNPNTRIGTLLDNTLKINTTLNAKTRQTKIDETLIKVGLLPEHKHRYPHMFSGGQKQRIAIARAIILDPELIIADEPLSALDVSIQAQIINLLQNLQETMQISYLFISHDLNIVEHLADQVLVMYRGQVIENGNIEQIFDNPAHPYTQSLFASTPMFRKRFPNFLPPKITKNKQLLKTGCNFASRCPYVEKECNMNHPKTITQKNGHSVACFKITE